MGSHRPTVHDSRRQDGARLCSASRPAGHRRAQVLVEPVELPQYLAARGLALIEDVGADTYRDRYLTPLGRGHEPLSDFQRAALAEITDGRSGRA